MTVYERLIMRTRAARSLSLRTLAVLQLALLAGCGSPPPADDPSTAESSASPEAPEENDESTAAAPDPEPVRPSCSDGTCFECGSGLCPQGAYCDSGAPGGPACAWIQECPGSPSCSCLGKVLGASCTCDDGAGGPTVSCP